MVASNVLCTQWGKVVHALSPWPYCLHAGPHHLCVGPCDHLWVGPHGHLWVTALCVWRHQHGLCACIVVIAQGLRAQVVVTGAVCHPHHTGHCVRMVIVRQQVWAGCAAALCVVVVSIWVTQSEEEGGMFLHHCGHCTEALGMHTSCSDPVAMWCEGTMTMCHCCAGSCTLFLSLCMGSVSMLSPCRGSVEPVCNNDNVGCVPALLLLCKGLGPR